MKIKTISAIAVLALFVAACAKTPSSIPPSSIASSEYMNFSCSQMQAEYTGVSSSLTEAESAQRGMVAADAAGVFLVLIPPSALVGDRESDIAQYKGEKQALERAMRNRGCTA